MSARLFLGALVAAIVALRLIHGALSRRRASRLRGAGPRGAFRCPACGEARLVVTALLALPAGAPPDDAAAVDIEALGCRRCAFRGLGLRTVEPRGAELGPATASEDAVTAHVGYPMTPLEWGRLSSSILRCPAPRDRACVCPEHRRLAAPRAALGEVLRGATRFRVV